MNLPDIKEDLLRKLFIEQPGLAPSYILDDVLHAVNAAGQMLNAIGVPFWDTVAASLVFSNAVPVRVVSARKVQSVTSPTTGIPLNRCTSKTQLIQYEAVYESARANETDTGFQVARVFFAEAEKPSSLGRVRLHVGPAPLLSQTLTVEYVPTFERFTLADLSDTSKSPRVPSDYIETIFLPIARFFATRSHFFFDKDKLPELKEDYGAALAMIRRINPGVSIPSDEDLNLPSAKE